MVSAAVLSFQLKMLLSLAHVSTTLDACLDMESSINVHNTEFLIRNWQLVFQVIRQPANQIPFKINLIYY
jgi:hypothetical protein